MKRFRFSLDTVLDYKQQVLDAIQVEYATLMSRVRRQEEALEAAEAQYAQTNETFRESKQMGMTIADLRSYELGLQVIERQIRLEQQALDVLLAEEAALRQKLVASKVDTSSLEILRDKKLADYQLEVIKQEERFIDELFSYARSVSPPSLL